MLHVPGAVRAVDVAVGRVQDAANGEWRAERARCVGRSKTGVRGVAVVGVARVGVVALGEADVHVRREAGARDGDASGGARGRSTASRSRPGSPARWVCRRPRPARARPGRWSADASSPACRSPACRARRPWCRAPVVSGAVVSGGVIAPGSVGGGAVVTGSVVGGASSANAGAAAPTTSATTSIANPARSPRRRMMFLGSQSIRAQPHGTRPFGRCATTDARSGRVGLRFARPMAPRRHIRVPVLGKAAPPIGSDFVSLEAASGIVLLLAAAAALIWANTDTAGYTSWWHRELDHRAGRARDHRVARALGQRRADDGVLLRRRARDQARAGHGRAARPPARRAPGGRRARGHGRARAPVRRHQPRR